ncbi:hypothetical protein LTR27_003146 [Elasticomyces elasticus]|nr:hypothetical protein LTR27_003146 [Elasticomyces elasticus]
MAGSQLFSCACCQSKKAATSLTACTGCHLVHYCNRTCQQTHWLIHKKDCKSPLIKTTWQPGWEVSNRAPTFVGDGPPMTSIGAKKYFWGNVPAVDVLCLDKNEGKAYGNDLEVLFAASGDPRNAIKTIAALPVTYTNTLGVTMNDRDFDIVARNAIMMLVACVCPDKDDATDCVLHIWFSSMIRPQEQELLDTSIRPLIADVVLKIASKTAGSLQRKTWKLGNNTIRLTILKEQWTTLLSYFRVPQGVTEQSAQRIRTAVTMARRDHIDRSYLAQQPAHRVCMEKFRMNGILLPFGDSMAAFSIPNPTFFRTTDWPMMDSADPLNGWDWREVLKTDSGLATNDLYGKLTVSNIVDRAYLGVEKTVGYLGPLLQPRKVHSHATLLALFMNSVPEVMTEDESRKALATELKLVAQYMPPSRQMLNSRYGGQINMMMDASTLVRDVDKYMKQHQFDMFPQYMGMTLKEPHTLVEKWPLRVKLLPHQDGAKEEFKMVLSSSFTGIERYVEWQRTA